jgi:hypothetical protein
MNGVGRCGLILLSIGTGDSLLRTHSGVLYSESSVDLSRWAVIDISRIFP